MIPARRPLEDMIGELAEGLLSLKFGGPVRPTGIRFALPVEARFDGGQVIADVPRLHTRTDFDLPLGRLTLTLAEIPA
jgi:hypothetical protein